MGKLRVKIKYINGKTAEVLLLPHKNGIGYSYVNLTKGHICPCIFPSVDRALKDLLNYKNIKEYEYSIIKGDCEK